MGRAGNCPRGIWATQGRIKKAQNHCLCSVSRAGPSWSHAEHLIAYHKYDWRFEIIAGHYKWLCVCVHLSAEHLIAYHKYDWRLEMIAEHCKCVASAGAQSDFELLAVQEGRTLVYLGAQEIKTELIYIYIYIHIYIYIDI